MGGESNDIIDIYKDDTRMLNFSKNNNDVIHIKITSCENLNTVYFKGNFPNLKILIIEDNPNLMNIKIFSKMNSLVILTVKNNGTSLDTNKSTNFFITGSYISLSEIHAENNTLKKFYIDKTTIMKNLEDIYYVNNKTERLYIFCNLPKIFSLNCSHNYIASFNVFKNMSLLRHLIFNSNLLGNFILKIKMPNLLVLSLDNNRLKYVRLTNIMDKLKSLSIENNDLDRFIVDYKMEELVLLNIFNNPGLKLVNVDISCNNFKFFKVDSHILLEKYLYDKIERCLMSKNTDFHLIDYESKELMLDDLGLLIKAPL